VVIFHIYLWRYHRGYTWVEYRIDEYGGSGDVIGTRCDPYTGQLLQERYHHCCHSNLTRGLADHFGLSLADAEAPYSRRFERLYMCTGFTRDTGQYFMKASQFGPMTILNYLQKLTCWRFLAPVQRSWIRTPATPHPLDDRAHTDRGGVGSMVVPPTRNAYDGTHGR
jgi:hypothetical protein